MILFVFYLFNSLHALHVKCFPWISHSYSVTPFKLFNVKDQPLSILNCFLKPVNDIVIKSEFLRGGLFCRDSYPKACWSNFSALCIRLFHKRQCLKIIEFFIRKSFQAHIWKISQNKQGEISISADSPCGAAATLSPIQNHSLNVCLGAPGFPALYAANAHIYRIKIPSVKNCPQRISLRHWTENFGLQKSSTTA